MYENVESADMGKASTMLTRHLHQVERENGKTNGNGTHICSFPNLTFLEQGAEVTPFRPTLYGMLLGRESVPYVGSAASG